MALNYETLIRAASKPPEQRTATEVNDFIFPWLKQSLKKKKGIFQKISDEVIHDICKTIMIERRPAWDVVIRQGDPGDTFYIILQGSVNIYRLEDDAPKSMQLVLDTVNEFAKLDVDPNKREELIGQVFGNYIVTLVGGFDFGERALITNEPRSATVMTIVPTDLLVVDREVFSRTLKAAHEKELQEKTDFINRSPVFSSWSTRLKRLVSLNLERGRFSYDSVLYKQGTDAEAVYFIWNGEVKLSMDPLLHWLQYPNILPKSDPMKQRALDLFLPMLQSSEPTNVHVPSTSTISGHRESFAIKRRHMTFAEAEKERAERILQLALLTTGDIVGLDSYVCDLPTYMNSARCTAPCDLFYILQHNFLRLQKRHSAQGLTDGLREMVRLSLKVYPPRIVHLPLFTILMKKQLASSIHNEQQEQYHNKQSWLLSINSPATHSNSRRLGRSRSTYLPSKDRLTNTTNASNMSTNSNSSQPTPLGSIAAIKYVTNDHVRVEKIEDRLKKWHAQLGEDSKPQIRPLTRYNVTGLTADSGLRIPAFNPYETQSNGTIMASSVSGSGSETDVSTELLLKLINNVYESKSSYPTEISYPSAHNLPSIRIYSKRERYEDLRAYLKQAYKEFLKRSIPTVY